MAACTVPFFAKVTFLASRERQILPPGRKGSAAATSQYLDYENK